MSTNIVIAPYSWLGKIWTTKWYNYIKHLIEDFNWICIDISNKSQYKPKLSLKELLKPYDDIKNVLYWHQNKYWHFNELFTYDIDPSINIHFYYDDLHMKTRDKYNECNKFAKVIFSSCPQKAISAYLGSKNASKSIFIPHAATNEFKIPLNDNAENKISLTGAINHCYPHRQLMSSIANKQYFKGKIVTLRHPGYDVRNNNSIVGDKYAEYLSRYIAGFTSSTIMKCGNTTLYFLISKFIEIPATGSLLLANNEIRDELEKLGFKDMENYIEYTKEDLEDKIKFVLDENNNHLINKIRSNGQNHVWNNHMAYNRAELIHKTICNN